MKTNVTYQDDADPEDCEFAIFGDDVTAVPLVGELVVIHDPDRSDEGPGVPYIVDERHWSVTPATRHQHGRADEPAYQHVTVVLVPRPEPVPVAERTSKVLATVYAGEGATLADRVDQLIATAFVGYHLSGDTVEINERLRDDVRALLTLHAITLRDVDRVAIVRWLRDRGVAEGGSMMDLDAIADAIERGHHLRLRGDR